MSYETGATKLIYIVLKEGDEGMAYESDAINVAIVNFKVDSGEKEVNLRRMISMSRAAAKRGADLILFPEMALMGYGMFIDETIPQEEKIRVTETVNGPSTKALEQVAKEEGIYIVFGMSEKLNEEDTTLYNSAVVLGPEGLIGSYQKIHPYGSENMWCARGEKPFMFDTKWGPISLGICYDNYQFPELVRYYVWKGSRLHLNPTFAAQEVPNEGAHHAFIRCYQPHLEYHVLSSSIYIASSNITGWDHGCYGGGGSMIIGPKTNEFEEVEVATYLGDAADQQVQVFVGTLDLTLANRHQCQDNPWGGGPDYRPSIYKKLFDEIG